MEFDLDGRNMPVLFEVRRSQNKEQFVFRNAGERIAVQSIEHIGDTIRFNMPVFNSGFQLVVRNEKTLKGTWINWERGVDYEISVKAHLLPAGQPAYDQPTEPLPMKWAVRFSPGTKNEYPAIGLLEYNSHGGLEGTFVTETGDYRFLEGTWKNDSLLLSCFDGSHAFLFKGHMKSDTLHGMFQSGSHWSEPWKAWPDQHVTLENPDSLTRLRPGEEMINFSFATAKGTVLSPKEAPFINHVTIVQIMGTWCPNCMDETRLLNELYAQREQEGLRIMGLAFEKHNKFHSEQAIDRYKKALSVNYPIAYAGPASKDSAALVLPFLNHVMSYPTCIVLDKAGMVRRVHTGFYGPSTGSMYQQHRTEFDGFIAQLLAE